MEMHLVMIANEKRTNISLVHLKNIRTIMILN